MGQSDTAIPGIRSTGGIAIVWGYLFGTVLAYSIVGGKEMLVVEKKDGKIIYSNMIAGVMPTNIGTKEYFSKITNPEKELTRLTSLGVAKIDAKEIVSDFPAWVAGMKKRFTYKMDN